MDIERFREACLALPQACEELPFGDDVLVFKVADKCFAFVFLRGEDLDAYLKCDAEYALQLRAHYDAITPARTHLNRKYWNSVYFERSSLSTPSILHLIRHSYRQVLSGLSRKRRAQLPELAWDEALDSPLL